MTPIPFEPPLPWLWSCHRCHSRYPLGVTRRCLHDGHYFCGGTTVSELTGRPIKRHKACASEFDYAGWIDMSKWQARLANTAEGEHIRKRRSTPSCETTCSYPSACHHARQRAAARLAALKAQSGKGSRSIPPALASTFYHPIESESSDDDDELDESSTAHHQDDDNEERDTTDCEKENNDDSHCIPEPSSLQPTSSPTRTHSTSSYLRSLVHFPKSRKASKTSTPAGSPPPPPPVPSIPPYLSPVPSIEVAETGADEEMRLVDPLALHSFACLLPSPSPSPTPTPSPSPEPPAAQPGLGNNSENDNVERGSSTATIPIPPRKTSLTYIDPSLLDFNFDVGVDEDGDIDMEDR